MTEPQMGGTYSDLAFACHAAEQAGLGSFCRSDHYYWPGKPGLDATDAFASLGGLARETGRIRLVVLVTPITFRHPAVIAKSAVTLDQMSEGRFDLGIGTGWMEAEHNAFGIPFPPWKERFERLEESLQYVRALFGGTSFDGRYYRTDADANPRPTGLRIVVGGSGAEKTPALAGRFADEYNQFVTSPDELGPKIVRMRAAATEHGRDPASIEVSVMGPAMLASNERRLQELLAKAAAFRNITVDELLERWTKSRIPMGTSEQAGPSLANLEKVGVEKYYLQWLDLSDHQGIEEQVSLAGSIQTPERL
jgi:alkanesulfonate monooxygenase SsuD/methylene tetrahydromethanopterin reductase-like flavin-dependent oxidoreductase (luciferase family)